jgi:aminobenzoyl-glutamate utilization protein B
MLVASAFWAQPIFAQKLSPQKIKALQKKLSRKLIKEKNFLQVNDMIFSFAELGFQETETSQYLINLLEKEGFTIQKGISGIPTAWIATGGR